MSKKPAARLRFQSARAPARAALPVGKKQQLHIERLAHDGRGIGFAQGRTWFVAGALAQELVTAQVSASKGKTVDARALHIDKPSELRQQPFCPHAGDCGGCTLQHMSRQQQNQFKQEHLSNRLQRAGVAPVQLEPMLSGAQHSYRRRARLALRLAKNGQLQFGFRALASQQIVAIKQCPILVEPLQQLLVPLRQSLESLHTARAIGHLELFYGNQAALLVRLTDKLAPADQQLLRDFCQQHQVQLWWQDSGQPYADQDGQMLYYSLPEFDLQIDYQPGDFVQVNAQLNRQMIVQALDWLQPQPGDKVLDLFCGLGNFSLPLARTVQQVMAVEGVASMVGRARQCAGRQNLSNVEFFTCDLSADISAAAWAQQQYDLVVLDPPRDGAQNLASQVGRFAAGKLLYVSCNPATLARDAAIIVQQGYQLQRLAALDMFSQTGHVEAMALFELGSK